LLAIEKTFKPLFALFLITEGQTDGQTDGQKAKKTTLSNRAKYYFRACKLRFLGFRYPQTAFSNRANYPKKSSCF